MIEIETESIRFNTRIILKKEWFSDFEILEIWGQVNSEKYEKDLSTRSETLNTEKPEEPPIRIEIQNTEKRKLTDRCNMK